MKTLTTLILSTLLTSVAQAGPVRPETMLSTQGLNHAGNPALILTAQEAKSNKLKTVYIPVNDAKVENTAQSAAAKAQSVSDCLAMAQAVMAQNKAANDEVYSFLMGKVWIALGEKDPSTKSYSDAIQIFRCHGVKSSKAAKHEKFVDMLGFLKEE